MKNEIGRFPTLETGGLLLGYSNPEMVQVLEATDGGYQKVLHAEQAFSYDIDYETHMCHILGELYDPALDIVGVWHKHNEMSAIPFSRADEKMHRQLMEASQAPCLSILFEKREETIELEANYNARVFLLKNSEHEDVSDFAVWM